MFAGDQETVWSIKFCIGPTLPFWTCVVSVVSSIYLCTAQGRRKSLMSIMKRRGPSHDPWGTDPFRLAQSDNSDQA